MKIKAILECLNSKTDVNGNRYWALRYTDPETGKQVTGTVSGGESNISAIRREMGLEWDEIYYYRTEMGKREFRALTAEWAYAGCAPAALAWYIQKQIAIQNSMDKLQAGVEVCPKHDLSAKHTWPPCKVCGYWKADYRPEGDHGNGK